MYSLKELGKLYPSVESIAAVPVGLTKYREGLFPLRPYTKEEAQEVIKTIHAFSDDFLQRKGVRMAYPADEFFLKAEMPIPDDAYYGEYNQLENGVGMITLLRDEFREALAAEKGDANLKRTVTLVTGKLAGPILEELTGEMKEKFPNVKIRVRVIRNDFFGERITVAGLLTGQDIVKQLKDKNLGEALYLPRNVLRSGADLFLDDYTLADVEGALQVPVNIVKSSGYDLVDALLGIAGSGQN